MNQPIPTQSSVTEQAAQVISHQAEGLKQVLNDAGELARQGIERARLAGVNLKDQAKTAGDSTVNYIREEPVKAVLIAAAVGAVSAALISWLSSQKRG